MARKQCPRRSKADDAKELRRLKDEKARLKPIVADRDIDIEILKEAGRGNR